MRAGLAAGKRVTAESTEEATYRLVRDEPPRDRAADRLLVPPVGLIEPEQPRRRPRQGVKIDEPPKRVFFSNVFGFPLQGSVIGQWLLIAGGFTVLALINLLLVSMYLAASSLVSGAMAFIALPAFWIGLWVLSYTAACFFVVVQETGAGNNEIREWMEGGWKEWAAELFCLLYVAALPMIVAWPIVKLSGYTYAEAAIPLLAIEFLFFPFALLSALEQDSVWLPFSRPVLVSLAKAFDGWFIFFTLSAILFAACGGLVMLSLQTGSLALAFVIGPVFSAAVLIYGRLIGRLGWLILDRVPRRDTPKPELVSIPD